MNKLREAIQRKALANSGDSFLLRIVADEALSGMKEQMNKLLAEFNARIIVLFSQTEKDAKKEILSKVEQYVRQEIPKLKGEPGYTPRRGVDYFDGIDGKTPIKGIDYKDGETPSDTKLTSLIQPLIPAPIKGDNGEDGETPTQQELIELLTPTVQKMLKDFSVRIQKGGGGGGGMGEPKHEQFSGDGVTTSFTLAHRVAANGMAVFGCRYQGQTLYVNDQYTVSGKTLSLIGFTPDDGTKIEITYIRT